MARRLKSSSQAFSQQAAELSVAAPQVVRHRVRQMALAGAFPSEQDQKEFKLMSQEKMDAFQESVQAMAFESINAQQKFVVEVWSSLFRPWTPDWNSNWSNAMKLPYIYPFQAATMGVLNKGMQPIHRRAVANAKRLGRF